VHLGTLRAYILLPVFLSKVVADSLVYPGRPEQVLCLFGSLRQSHNGL